MTDNMSICAFARETGFPLFPNKNFGWGEIPANATHLRFENINGPSFWKNINDPVIERIKNRSPHFYSKVEETWNQGLRIHYCTGWAVAPGWERPVWVECPELSVAEFLAS